MFDVRRAGMMEECFLKEAQSGMNVLQSLDTSRSIAGVLVP